jgi:hypothetical protein
VTNRKFQTGKDAKKMAEFLTLKRQQERELAENSIERKKTQQILEEYREIRGPTLMEAHFKKKNQVLKDGSSSQSRKGFDWERVRCF